MINYSTPTAITHEMVAIDSLIIDPRVQRKEGIRARRARSIGENFNPDALGTITVSRRADGTNVLLDGAHRTEGARIAGYNKPLHALVHTGLTLQQEAAIFALLNTFQQPSFISRMLAEVTAGDPDSTQIVDAITRHGWEISFDSNDGYFAALSAAERIYKNGAGTLPPGKYPELLDRVMATITSAWRHDRESVHQMIVLGIGQLYGRFGDAVDPAYLATKLSQERPNMLIGNARALKGIQGGNTQAAMAKVIVGVYNRKRRTRLLPEWVWTR